MKQFFPAVCLLAVFGLVSTGCGGAAPSSPPAAAGTVLTRKDTGKTFTFVPGANFRIELAGNATTGYAWQVAARGDSVTVAKSTYVPDDHAPGLVGSGGRQIFPCVAVRKGATTIRLTYARPWETGETGEEVDFKIVVR